MGRMGADGREKTQNKVSRGNLNYVIQYQLKIVSAPAPPAPIGKK